MAMAKKTNHSRHNHGTNANAVKVAWQPSIWSYRQQSALSFGADEDLNAAIDLLWNDAELRGMPRVHVGERTMIVPTAAVPLFCKKARNFTATAVVSAGDLPAEEVNRIRRGVKVSK
jgi:hypothetical protein